MRSLLLLAFFLPILAWGQVTVVQSPIPKFQSFTVSGVPNVGGCVYTFASGTSTPQSTYTDSTGLIQNQNPTILDGSGSASIFITGQVYRFQVWTFGSGSVGSNCGNGTQLYQIDGIKEAAFAGPLSNLAAVVTVLTATNNPTITTINPAGASQNYNIPDPGTGGNFIINPSGNSGTSNTLDCTLSGITCKRTASYYFRGGQCNGTTPSIGWDTFGGYAPQPLCVTGTNIQKGAMGLPSAYTHIQQNSGTSNAAGTITTTYPAATVGSTGDLLVLSVAFNGTTTITGCTDGTNAYTQAKHIANGALSVDIWYFLNAATKTAGTTLTCTFAANATGSLKWHEYIAPNSVSLDVTQSNSGTSASASTGSTASIAQATELSFGAAGNIANASEINATSGYVDHSQIASNSISVVDDGGLITQSIAAQSETFTLGSSQIWAAAIATFKATNGTDSIAQQTIVLPAFYNSSQAVNAVTKWVVSASPTGTSNAFVGAAIVCVPDGNTDDVALNADTTSTLPISNVAPNLPTALTLNGLSQGSCAAGQTLHFQIKRLRYNAADTYEGLVGLMGAQLQIGITQ